MNNITRDTFAEMDENSKLNILFDLLDNAYKCACDTKDKLETLEKKVDNRKKFDTTIAGGAGVIGGIIAHMGEWLIGGKH